MILDKDLASLAQLEPGLPTKDQRVREIAFLFVDMEPTAPVALCLVWNVPRTVSLLSLHLMASNNALPVPLTFSPSNLDHRAWRTAGPNVSLEPTLTLALLLVPNAQSTSSSL